MPPSVRLNTANKHLFAPIYKHQIIYWILFFYFTQHTESSQQGTHTHKLQVLPYHWELDGAAVTPIPKCFSDWYYLQVVTSPQSNTAYFDSFTSNTITAFLLSLPYGDHYLSDLLQMEQVCKAYRN